MNDLKIPATAVIRWLMFCAIFFSPPLNAEEPEAAIRFNEDVRPLLSDRCFRCHGPDEQTREADLRLDTLQGLHSSPSGAPVVVPGDVEQSELLARIYSADSDLVMPPPESNKSLSNDEKALLREWIQQGAPWEQHWSFQSLKEPELPKSEFPHRCQNEIDRFIQAKLQDAGLEPSETSDPYLLVRRLHLDLVGLLPSTAEAETWVRDIWPDPAEPNRINEEAYQRLVSHLLASPQYGERWARSWLDLARYADTNGYEKDRDRSIWPYRDWVINALNADMPFDQFTIEQLAGDQLPNPTQAQRVATGFHRNTMLNEEGGIDPLEFRFHAMTDRVATTGTTWLGLTLGCCQCHTHKYDPISHTEYYQFMAFLNNADEPQLELIDEDFDQKWSDRRSKAKALVAKLASHWPAKSDGEKPQDPLQAETSKTQRQPTLEQAFEQWCQQEHKQLADWQTLQPIKATSNLPILTIEEQGVIFASGDTAKRDEYVIDFAPQSQPIRALQLEALPDERLPARGPGSTYYEGTLGDFYLTEIRIFEDGELMEVTSASESYAKNRYGKNPVSAQLTLDNDVQTGWSVHDRQGERHVAVYLLKEPIPAGAKVRIEMVFGRHFASSLGKFRFSSSAVEKPIQARDYTADELKLLSKSQQGVLSNAEKQQLQDIFLMRAPELKEHSQEIRKLLARPKLVTTLVMQERPEGQQRPTFRHHRGEYLQPQEKVQASTPDVLHAFPSDAPRDRLHLAKWITADKNPLTPRVMVNRAWASFFGTGLVRTVDDFGFQGEAPSHPALLDWLALRFLHDDDWSMKKLHRRIVSSHTYRQSSTHPQTKTNFRSLDPENRLLSVYPRTRLEAEILRDAMLVASGKLVTPIGGPPVRPPQPGGVTELAYGSPKWNVDTGENRYRRSLYTYTKRTAPFAMFNTFDAPSGEACVARRTRSNSPLQALTLLNDVMVLELAQFTGIRFAKAQNPQQGITNMFQAALTRPPTATEMARMRTFLDEQTTALALDPDAATALVGEHSKTKTVPEAEDSLVARQAAWIALARIVFSLDEFQTRN